MNKELLVILLVLLVFGFKIYQKYAKKDQVNPGKKTGQGSSFPTAPGDDDYEPYSKK